MCNRKGHIAIFHGRTSMNSNAPSTAPRRSGKNNIDFETSIVDPETKKDDAGKSADDAASKEDGAEVPTI